MLHIRRSNAIALWASTGRLTPAARQQTTIGGRHSRAGAGGQLGKHPLVKQGPALGVPRRVPGTAKVRYTNEKGRTFSFSIPVGQLTHPPTIREAATPGGWRDIDTTYSDTGELDEDMPSPVTDVLRRYVVRGDGEPIDGTCASVGNGTGDDDVYLKIDEAGLQELHAAYVDFCRQYVLMDTQGMKSSLSYAELNTGPDYEMHDRKLMRKRYWLSIRHLYEDIRELLWPSALLNGGGVEEPTLSAVDMLDALVWLEAASTFCVRAHRPYDTAGARDFLPIDLSLEMRVLASRVRSTVGAAFFAEAADAAPDSRIASDRFISCAALCVTHGVPFSDFFPESTASGLTKGNGVQAVLAALPPLHKAKDAIRVMSVLDTVADSSSATESRPYGFSDPITGDVTDADMLTALGAVCGGPVSAAADALENVGETELCAILRFIVRVREQNSSFFQRPGGASHARTFEAERRARAILDAFTALTLSRCRYLLYRLGGPQTGVVSGDDEYVPLVELQRLSEASHEEVRVHYKIGMENVMGMRFARLRAKGSATLVELLDRLEATGERKGVRSLLSDLVQHVAHKAATRGERLSLEDIIRVLPLLAKLRGDHPDRRHERLLSAISTAIGAELAVNVTRSPEDLAAVLEGLAECRYVPTSLPQLEMVLLRMALRRRTPLPTMDRALTALAQLVGPAAVPQSLLQAAAAMVVDASQPVREGQLPPADALALARTLHHCHYSAFASMIEALVETGSDVGAGAVSAEAPAAASAPWAVVVAFAAAAVPEEDARCATLSATGKAAMDAYWSSMGPAGDETTSSGVDVDLFYDLIASCAALGVVVPLESVQRLEQTLTGRLASDSSSVSDVPLHRLCTPLLAVSTLESLEALGLESLRAYRANMAYVERVLLALQPGVAGRTPLLPDDATVAMRVLLLRRAPTRHRELAKSVLEAEVLRLDAALESTLSSGADSFGYTGVTGHRASAAPSSFEQRTLAVRERAAELEEKMLCFCAALQADSPAFGA